MLIIENSTSAFWSFKLLQYFKKKTKTKNKTLLPLGKGKEKTQIVVDRIWKQLSNISKER
jgi:hypothetical protein